MIQIVDNFFSLYSNDYYLLCKGLDFYEIEKFKEITGHDKVDFPGKRTLQLKDCSPFLYINLVNLCYERFNVKLDPLDGVYCHARFAHDKPDWIHTDDAKTIIVFLSETNLQSGTCFYDNNNQQTMDVGFVHNRAVMFNGNIKHKSKENYGTTLDDCRMTINIFLKQ